MPKSHLQLRRLAAPKRSAGGRRKSSSMPRRSAAQAGRHIGETADVAAFKAVILKGSTSPKEAPLPIHDEDFNKCSLTLYNAIKSGNHLRSPHRVLSLPPAMLPMV